MPEEKRPLKVFLSYASQDKIAVHELSQRLASEGWIDPWVDEKKLLPGQDWRTKIEEAVETSDNVIICLSSSSVGKEGFVQKELRYAREIAFEKPDETIFLIPLRLDDCLVPRGLRFYQWGDYFGEGQDDTYTALLEALKIRHEQKSKLEEEERARLEKERKERETAEKVKREKAEQEALKIATQERLEREVWEKVTRERLESETAEKLAQEKAKRDETEKIKREKAERQAARKIAFAASIKSFFSKMLPFLKIVGFIFLLIGFFLISSWTIPTLFSSSPSPTISLTLSLLHTSTPTHRTVNTPSPEFVTVDLFPTWTPTETQAPTPTLKPTSSIPLPTQITDAEGVKMIFIPGGEFTMGDSYYGNSTWEHKVYLDEYYIDKYEVTVALYKACVRAGVCISPDSDRRGSSTRTDYYEGSKYLDYPMIYVSWYQAQTYCEWRGGGLPTEAQWEKAARGEDERENPWGAQSYCDYANFCEDDTTAVGARQTDKSPYGVYDLGGNVSEWVADWYSEDYYMNSPYANPTGPESGLGHVIRGLSYAISTFGFGDIGDPSAVLRHEWELFDNGGPNWIGFRCAKDATP